MNAIRYRRCEIVLHSNKTYENPFADVMVDAVFTHEDGTVVSLPGFWNGENEWKVRFLSEKTGTWKYSVTNSANDPDLKAEGEIVVEDAAPRNELEKHGYVRLAPGKRYFVYGDGTPFFWLGDTHWQMPDFERLHECNYPGCTCGNQFKHAVDDRVKKGFTIYQTYFDGSESDGGGNKRVHHWWAKKHTHINPEAFNETMDVMIEYLASQGITTALGFGLHCTTPGGYGAKAEPMLAFARYCVARYACYPVVWITAQEITNMGANAFALWQQVGELVGKLDGFHRPNGAHQHVHFADANAPQVLEKADWHQFWALQAGHGPISALKPRRFYQGYRDFPKGKPYFETECHYEDLGGSFCGDCAPRMGAWNAILCGCSGYTYGVTGLWAMGWNQRDDRAWTGYSPEPWYVGLDKPGSTQMTYLKKFFEYVGWTDLEPEFGHKYGSFEVRKYVNIAHKGDKLFIYYFFGDFEDDDLGRLTDLKPGIRYQARWYDPIHGTFTDLPDMIPDENGEMEVPKKPSVRDWVLLLNTEDLGPYKNEPYPAMKRTIAPFEATPGKEIPVKKVTVSGYEEGHEPEKMFDGDPETYWTPFKPYVSNTMILDLGEVKKPGWFYLSTASSMPTTYIRYRVYLSKDGENYEFFTERCRRYGVAIGGPYKEYYDYLDGEARYVKIYFQSTEADAKLQFNKFAVYEPKENQ